MILSDITQQVLRLMETRSGKAMIQTIVSGGQTGADWAALDWAIDRSIPHGGWCPSPHIS
jgi:Circularly permutated YpsA SLOG family